MPPGRLVISGFAIHRRQETEKTPTDMIVVAVSANHNIRFSASCVEGLVVILLDRISLDEVPQGGKFDVWVSCCAAATGVDEDNDRVIDLGIYEGKLSVLVSLNYAKCGRVQPGAGEAGRWTVVAVLAHRDHD